MRGCPGRPPRRVEAVGPGPLEAKHAQRVEVVLEPGGAVDQDVLVRAAYDIVPVGAADQQVAPVGAAQPVGAAVADQDVVAQAAEEGLSPSLPSRTSLPAQPPTRWMPVKPARLSAVIEVCD